jgi:hypothetical protein
MASALKPGESGFEQERQGARSRRTVSGSKIKKGGAPLGVKNHQVMESGLAESARKKIAEVSEGSDAQPLARGDQAAERGGRRAT